MLFSCKSCENGANLLLGLLVNRVQVPDSASRLSTVKEQVICAEQGLM